MRIETKPTLEAYIGKEGNICLKQEDFDGKEKTIVIPREMPERSSAGTRYCLMRNGILVRILQQGLINHSNI
jgi:hypothetical protein